MLCCIIFASCVCVCVCIRARFFLFLLLCSARLTIADAMRIAKKQETFGEQHGDSGRCSLATYGMVQHHRPTFINVSKLLRVSFPHGDGQLCSFVQHRHRLLRKHANTQRRKRKAQDQPTSALGELFVAFGKVEVEVVVEVD